MTGAVSRRTLLRAGNQRLHELTLDSMSAAPRDELYEQLRSCSPPELDQLREFAVRNRVAPIVAHKLLDALPTQDSVARAPWEDLHAGNARRMHTLLNQLDLVGEALAEHEIRVVALKNAGIARGVFECAACCPMGDLDVLIDRERFVDAHEAIIDLGYTLASRSSVDPADVAHGLQAGGTEYVRTIDDEDVWLELQWRAVAGRWIRKDQEPSSVDLLTASRQIPGTHVRLLSAVDNLLQVCLHTAKHSYVRAPGLRLHTDVDRLVTYDPPDWDEFVARVTAMHVRTPTYFSLALASALLGTPIPDEVLEKLQPNRLKRETVVRWLRTVDIFEPDQRKFNRVQMIGFHSLLYDTPRGFLASVLDTDEDHLGLRHLPRNARRGSARVRDLVTRYER